ncbi:uncharacterized protein LOC143916196 [Arctopsyche grandis]|uniref:uncharacterized protein LOC143916196 n=1 Tax=Arctopsyche grandis TaxID=121162 RepID=UPI00406D8416
MAYHSGSVMIFVLVLSLFSMSHAYAVAPQMDPVDRCIFTCIHCYKDNNIEVICANECLATEGKMHPFWLKTCPEFTTPYMHVHGFELDNTFNPDVIDNNLKK